MTSFLWRAKVHGGHIVVHCFAGPDGQDRAYIGKLTLLPQEWAALQERLCVPGHRVEVTDE